MLNLPKKNFCVKIGPFIYDVFYDKEISNETESFGRTNSNEQKIFLDPTKKDQKIRQTFIHELFHACMFVNGLCYRFDSKDKQPEEEDIARELSVTFYQVMMDNPKIFKGGV